MQVLYWIYAGRLVICLTVYGLAVLVGDFLSTLAPGPLATQVRLIGIIGLSAAAVLTPVAYWHSHRRHRRVSRAFLYSQALLDVLLANGIVHVTGGSQSPFVSLFIALAAAYALVLPLSPAVLVAAATGGLYLLDNLIAFPNQVTTLALLLQVAVFTLVAVATSFVGARLRDVRLELRGVEGELRRLRLDTADILRIIPSGVITLDSDGRTVYMNLAAAELLELEAHATLGQPILPLIERKAPDVAVAIEETIRTGRRVRDREAEVFLSAGAPNPGSTSGPPHGAIPVAVSTTLVQEAGSGPSHVVLVQDLRATRQIEDLRLRTGRLEAVAELSASLAHELKNPMASVHSAVEQLCASAREDEDDRLLARLIIRESDRMGRILGEFSDFARVDVAQRQPVDLERILRAVLETSQRHPAAEGRARFELDIAPDTEGLWGDPELLHRVLLNLVLNALQIGDPEDPVLVRVVADSVRPDLIPSEISVGNPVRIRVIDDGPGIPEEDLLRIFDPFFTRREGGSGLGLSIAHRAVQAHGGTLIASSRPGEGATFAVVLPRRAKRPFPLRFEDRRILDEKQSAATGGEAEGAPAAAGSPEGEIA